MTIIWHKSNNEKEEYKQWYNSNSNNNISKLLKFHKSRAI